MWLKIGQLAKRAGLIVRTLHHYDDIGLLSPSARSDNGFRLYNQADVIRLHRIQALKQLGCSLAEIRAFLAEPGASLIDILTQQMRILDEQVERAQTLRDRLFRLRERVSKGEDTGLTDWLTILELMTMYEKHLSREELDTLRTNRAAGNLDNQWRQLVPLVQDAMDRGISPESQEAQQLAWRWIWLLRDTTGNDVGLAMKLKVIHRNEEKAQLLNGITPKMIDYLSNSFAHARAAILAKYLSPDELEDVLRRQATHGSGWLALIAEIREQIRQGAAPDSPVVQALVCRCQSLFRESFSGEVLELEGKIRSAFQEEPDLLASVGMDAQVIAFIQQAILQSQGFNDKGCDRPDPVPKPTALSVARFRAAHQLLDDPLVFEDPLALRILGAAEEAALRRDPRQYITPLFKGLRTSVVVRSRMAEDEWARSKQRGIRQYVILGAGLDTFAYRNREQDGTRIFEVDLPETQQWKRLCLLAADIKEPASLTFVPINFERSTLAEALKQGGFSPDDAAFFSWLGVTMYLEEAAIISTLCFIAALPPGSGVVFDYAVLPSLLPPREHRAMELLASRVAERGEPWKTYLDPTSLSRTLHSMGFSEVENLGPEQLNQRYLSGRKDGLRKSGVSRLVCARV